MITNMKIEDLRIGNWILGTNSERKSELKPFQVYAETFCDIESTYGIFEPIPISEDILLKCGFEYIKEVGYCDKNNVIYQTANGWELLINCIDKCNVEIKYLHQLQNITYFLINEELKVNI